MTTKAAMIGVRGHNQYVFRGLQERPTVQLSAICTGTPHDQIDSLDSWCRENGYTPQVFSDYRAMLDQVQPDIVTIGGPLEQHAEMSIEALTRKINVFCEKPVAITLADLQKLKTVYHKTRTDGTNLPHFSAMMGLRYNPAFYTAWRVIKNGQIGKVRLINTRKSYKLGHRQEYYTRRETYGGTIPWVGSHAIDWIAWFSGEQFLSVYANHSDQYNQELGNLEMSALCQFTLTNQVYASASIDYFRPPSAPTHGDDFIRVVGTDGVVEVRSGCVFLINQDSDGEQQLETGCDRQIFSDFVDHVTGKTTALLGTEDVFAVTEACLLARQSADEGEVVHFK